jgi:hypothetical protein
VCPLPWPVIKNARYSWEEWRAFLHFFVVRFCAMLFALATALGPLSPRSQRAFFFAVVKVKRFRQPAGLSFGQAARSGELNLALVAERLRESCDGRRRWLSLAGNGLAVILPGAPGRGIVLCKSTNVLLPRRSGHRRVSFFAAPCGGTGLALPCDSGQAGNLRP